MCRKMVEMHKIINSTFDNAPWNYSWNPSLEFNTEEHSSLKKKEKKKDFASERKHIDANRHFKYLKSSQISSAMPNKLLVLCSNKYKC